MCHHCLHIWGTACCVAMELTFWGPLYSSRSARQSWCQIDVMSAVASRSFCRSWTSRFLKPSVLRPCRWVAGMSAWLCRFVMIYQCRRSETDTLYRSCYSSKRSDLTAPTPELTRRCCLSNDTVQQNTAAMSINTCCCVVTLPTAMTYNGDTSVTWEKVTLTSALFAVLLQLLFLTFRCISKLFSVLSFYLLQLLLEFRHGRPALLLILLCQPWMDIQSSVRKKF